MLLRRRISRSMSCCKSLISSAAAITSAPIGVVGVLLLLLAVCWTCTCEGLRLTRRRVIAVVGIGVAALPVVVAGTVVILLGLISAVGTLSVPGDVLTVI